VIPATNGSVLRAGSGSKLREWARRPRRGRPSRSRAEERLRRRATERVGSGQSEYYEERAGWFGPASTGGDRDVLPAVHFVRCRSSVTGEWQNCLPEKLAGLFVKGAKLAVVMRCADEEESTGSYNAPPMVLRARVFESLRNQLGIFAERNLPGIVAGIQVDG
jgi:hypothetical protein